MSRAASGFVLDQIGPSQVHWLSLGPRRHAEPGADAPAGPVINGFQATKRNAETKGEIDFLHH